jgi:hypothetical protein
MIGSATLHVSSNSDRGFISCLQAKVETFFNGYVNEVFDFKFDVVVAANNPLPKNAKENTIITNDIYNVSK